MRAHLLLHIVALAARYAAHDQEQQRLLHHLLLSAKTEGRESLR